MAVICTFMFPSAWEDVAGSIDAYSTGANPSASTMMSMSTAGSQLIANAPDESVTVRPISPPSL